jgi:hypothetical protein
MPEHEALYLFIREMYEKNKGAAYLYDMCPDLHEVPNF